MKRSCAALANAPFDVLIVGAGIYGSTLALAASRRRLRVALVDAGDFGGGASANSLKIIHGGLRYLQHGNVKRMRESIRARSQLLRLAPQTVRPLPCLMPTRGNGTRSRWVMGAALAVNRLISADRNRDVNPYLWLPPGKIISRAELEKLAPGCSFAGNISGAALWFDALAENTDRLNLAFVQAAVDAGATAANYVRAHRLITDRSGVVGAEAEDVLTGATFEIRAGLVVCAAGPGNQALWPKGAPTRWVKASNLVLRKPLLEKHALAVEGKQQFKDSDALIPRGRRNFFAVPWIGGTLIGTHYAKFDPATDSPTLASADIGDFVRQVNDAAVLPEFVVEDVVRVHVGILPAADGSEAEPAKTASDTSPVPGLVLVQGEKYTTAIETAVEIAAGFGGTEPQSAIPVLPWREPSAELADLVSRAVSDEMAVKLGDVIMRRSRLGDFGLPGRTELETCATLMATQLGWDEKRRKDEISELVRANALPHA